MVKAVVCVESVGAMLSVGGDTANTQCGRAKAMGEKLVNELDDCCPQGVTCT